MENLCQLDRLKLSCFGCCTNNLADKEALMKDIAKNTLELRQYSGIKEFASRSFLVRASGLCFNVVHLHNKIVCAAHPALNNGVDYRDSNCMEEYICRTFYYFKKWSKETQKKFIDLIASKNYDHYEYSVAIKTGKLLDEFLKTHPNASTRI